MVHSQARLNAICATDLRALPGATSHDGSSFIVRRTVGCRGTPLSVLSRWDIKMWLGILTVQMAGKLAAFRSKKPNLLRQMTSRNSLQVLLDAARQREHPLFYGGRYFAYIANRFATVFKNSRAPFNLTRQVFNF